MAVAESVALGSAISSASSVTSFPFTTTNTVPSGGFIEVGVGGFATSPPTSPNMSGGGLTWANDKTVVNGSDRVWLWTAQAPSGLASGTVITATWVGGVDGPIIAGRAFTGVLSSAPLDITSSATGSGTAWNAGTMAGVTAGDLANALAWGDGASSSSTPGGSYGESFDIPNAGALCVLTLTRLLGSGTSESPTGTWAASETWAAVGATYKAAAVAAGAPELVMAPMRR